MSFGCCFGVFSSFLGVFSYRVECLCLVGVLFVCFLRFLFVCYLFVCNFADKLNRCFFGLVHDDKTKRKTNASIACESVGGLLFLVVW